ncbi:hypothetical protein EON67_04120 [archaeon]|nr:MAG: hypothetical protein EON67_04120 [archaeon]
MCVCSCVMFGWDETAASIVPSPSRRRIDMMNLHARARARARAHTPSRTLQRCMFGRTCVTPLILPCMWKRTNWNAVADQHSQLRQKRGGDSASATLHSQGHTTGTLVCTHACC